MVADSKKILVVDDEPNIVKVLSGYLRASGYQVVTAYDGSAALDVFRAEKPDFIILDLNLPFVDGVDVCEIIRRESNVPVMMLTARVEEADRLIGLEIGADDYVIKPFSPREVVARVKTILRRAAPETPVQDEVIEIGELRIDVAQHQACVGDRLVELTPTEFELVLTMARQPKRVFSRLQLLEQALGNNYEGYERTIDTHIKNIRTKLEPDPRQPRYILTVYGVGYRMGDGNA